MWTEAGHERRDTGREICRILMSPARSLGSSASGGLLGRARGHQLIVLIFGDERSTLDLAMQLAPAAIVLDLGTHQAEAARVHDLFNQPVARSILVVAILDHQVVPRVDTHVDRR